MIAYSLCHVLNNSGKEIHPTCSKHKSAVTCEEYIPIHSFVQATSVSNLEKVQSHLQFTQQFTQSLNNGLYCTKHSHFLIGRTIVITMQEMLSVVS